MAFFIGDRQILPGHPFKDENGVQYPANWLRLASAEEKERIGIVEKDAEVLRPVATKAQPKIVASLDDTKLKLKGRIVKKPNGDAVIKKGERTLALMQEENTMKAMLEDTNWYVLRSIETGEEIPSDIKKYRASVRATCKERCEMMNKCQNIEEFHDLLSNPETELPQYPVKEIE